MKYISADRIHDGKNWMPEKSVLAISDDGTINQIYFKEKIPTEKIELLTGIICPGFINVHCHLELSHLKNKVEEGTGLIPFLKTVNSYRNYFSTIEKLAALMSAINEIKQNGIVAIGDIANSLDTLEARNNMGLHIHTFIEALGFTEEKAIDRFAFYEKLYRAFSENTMSNGAYIFRQSIVPHAPYSISKRMFSLIDAFDKKSILTIHNQECQAENEFYETKTGDFIKFHKSLFIDNDFFKPTQTSSLKTYLPWLSDKHPLLLIHNTFMNNEDLLFLSNTNRKIFLGLCPKANWYIERHLPPLSLFKNSEFPICLGTDSLASNRELSIHGEMLFIKKQFPDIEWEKLLRWATWNGALALQMEEKVGSIEIGKKPGLIHLFGEGLKKMKVLY